MARTENIQKSCSFSPHSTSCLVIFVTFSLVLNLPWHQYPFIVSTRIYTRTRSNNKTTLFPNKTFVHHTNNVTLSSSLTTSSLNWSGPDYNVTSSSELSNVSGIIGNGKKKMRLLIVSRARSGSSWLLETLTTILSQFVYPNCKILSLFEADHPSTIKNYKPYIENKNGKKTIEYKTGIVNAIFTCQYTKYFSNKIGMHFTVISIIIYENK